MTLVPNQNLLNHVLAKKKPRIIVKSGQRNHFSRESGKPISVAFQVFADVLPEYHHKVSYDINGKKVIVVPRRKDAAKVASAQDGRCWGHSASTKWAGFCRDL